MTISLKDVPVKFKGIRRFSQGNIGTSGYLTDNRGTCIPLNDPHYYTVNNACYMQCCLFDDLLVMVALAFFTNHLSFQELLNYGTQCLPLFSPKPATYHPSNLASTNLILSLYPLNYSPFSNFFLCWGIVIGPKAFPHHYKLKEN